MTLEKPPFENKEEEINPSIDETKEEEPKHRVIVRKYLDMLMDLAKIKNELDKDNGLIEKVKSKLGINSGNEKTILQKNYEETLARLELFENQINTDPNESARKDIQEMICFSEGRKPSPPDAGVSPVDAINMERERRKGKKDIKKDENEEYFIDFTDNGISDD
jgi:hypothetical protein